MRCLAMMDMRQLRRGVVNLDFVDRAHQRLATGFLQGSLDLAGNVLELRIGHGHAHVGLP